jgi:hypothetical protein
MPEKTSYYAIVNEFSSRERPAGVIRRVEDPDGERDEAFTGDLVWKRTASLYAAERGNLDNQFVAISEDEAMRIVERIRREAGQS